MAESGLTMMAWFYEHYRNASAIGLNTTGLVHGEQSTFQRIEVHETVGHGRLLTLDGMVMLTELDEFVYHDLLTHVPLCTHAEPRHVLVVGGGDGGCVREALKHPSVERVVQCEIDERVTRVCQQYIPSVAAALEDPRVELRFEDAVAYVHSHPRTFDVVVVDSTEPLGPAQALFESPFFASIQRALRPGGVMAAQAESPFYATDVVRGLFRAARQVFRSVNGYYGVVPTYPGGLWTFCLASALRGPADIDIERAAYIDTRYFGPRLARGCFDLPPFVDALVNP